MTSPLVSIPPPPQRDPDVEDDFSDSQLRRDLWVDHYLPHWTTPDRSKARYAIGDGVLRLRIDSDQLDWRDEDGPLRVSNLQTGTFSGPPGSTRGTHRHRPDGLTVRTPTPTALLWAPSAGRVEVTVSASADEDCMLAAWLVGTEHQTEEQAGEVCLFEIDAASVGSSQTTARCGIKAHSDPNLDTDMAEVTVPIDASQPHTWTVIWGGGETVIGCESTVIRRLRQAPDYPLFLMLDLFEIGPREGRYPKVATLHRVRGWATPSAHEASNPDPGTAGPSTNWPPRACPHGRATTDAGRSVAVETDDIGSPASG